MKEDDETSDSASSSGYSSAASSGNSSPEIDYVRTTVDSFRFQDHEESSRRSNNSGRNNDASLVTVTLNNDQNNVPESIKQITRELAIDIVHHVVGRTKRKPSSKHAETLRRTTEEILTRHEIFFKSVTSKMQIDRTNANATFKNVADEMLSDCVYSWGRIVALYAFGARLAQYCYMMSKENDVELAAQIATFMGNYITEKFSVWINMNGGWDAFDNQFLPETHFEDIVKKGLIVTALGLGALASVILYR